MSFVEESHLCVRLNINNQRFMNKKMYVSPESETLELRLEGVIASSGGITNPKHIGLGTEDYWTQS